VRTSRAAIAFGVLGILLPIAILLIDRETPGGYWQNWILYVWPTSYMFIATSAIVNWFWYKVAVLSIGLNALIYALVGALVASGWNWWVGSQRPRQ
jgi:hypothetical protein